MNLERVNGGSAAAVGFLAASLIFAAAAAKLKWSPNVPPVDADRGAVISKALVDIRTTEEQALSNAAVIDAGHGTVRLPIARAMELAAQTWKNPEAARADLNARAENAAKELPKAPAKPSIFE